MTATHFSERKVSFVAEKPRQTLVLWCKRWIIDENDCKLKTGLGVI